MSILATILPYIIGIAVGGVVRRAITSSRAPDYDVENYFQGKNENEKQSKAPHRFPVITDKATVTLSVVVPAYNEEKRITPMLDEMIDELQSNAKKDKSFTWEILVVDDGSKDKTAALVLDQFVAKHGTDKFRLLKLYKNNGKGGAVRKGMVRARGEYVLFADADGATKAHETLHVLSQLKKTQANGLGMALGSRAHLDTEGDAKARRTPFRRFLMWGFHTLINVLIGSSDIKDTQCGFKMFTRAAVAKLFTVQHIDRWAFDVELVYLANALGIPMVEVPVEWNEIDGSKLDVVTSSIQMARDIFAIRVAYMLGIWKTVPTPSETVKTGAVAE